MPDIHVICRRLPRILTDQTATVGVASADNALDVMLPIVYEVQQMARPDAGAARLTIRPEHIPLRNIVLSIMSRVVRSTAKRLAQKLWDRATCAASCASRNYGFRRKSIGVRFRSRSFGNN